MVLQMVHEGAATGAVIERPAERMHDEPRIMARRIDAPELFDADAVFLRIDALGEVKALDQRLCERAARPLGEESVFGMQLDAGRVAVLVMAVARDAHIAGGDAFDAAIFVVEHFGGGESRIDLDSERLRLLPQPTA